MVSRRKVSLEDEDHTPARQLATNRKRSKIRPKFDQAKFGQVLAVSRGRFEIRLAAPDSQPNLIQAIKAREIGRKGVIVGDFVKVTIDDEETGRIVTVEPRKTMLRRSADDSTTGEKPIVANATQLGMVLATSTPTPNIGLADRAIIAAVDAGLKPLIIVTKCDLASPDSLIERFEALGVEVITSVKGQDLISIREALKGQTTVLIGESGVGKSTLVNALTPDAKRETGQVSSVTKFGRHTSSSLVAIALKGGGYLIDTPGLRTFGLAHVTVPDFTTKARSALRAESTHFDEILALVAALPEQRNY